MVFYGLMEPSHLSRPRIGIPCRRAATESELARYVEGVAAGGGAAVALRAGDGSADDLVALGGLLLIGGADIDPARYGAAPDPTAGLWCDAERDEHEFALVAWALRHDRPLLAICRGMQVLNVALGGKLLQNIPDHRRDDGESAYHDIDIVAGSRLAQLTGLAGRSRVNSRHHQGVVDVILAPGLRATAYRPDDGLIEALESPDHRFVVGVQCHPERSDEAPAQFAQLFAGLVAVACQTSERRVA